jgi:hypothetical protein
MFKRINSDYLVGHMRSYLNDMPQLDHKVSDYVVGIDYSPKAADAIIDYLESDENMYPSVEMRLLETLLRLRVPMSKDPIAKRICDLGQSLAYGKGAHQHKHWYSRSLGVLLIAKYGKDSDTRKLARLLMESGEHFDPEFKKHLLATALTLTAEKEVKEVVQFAKRQHDRELSRLTHFYEGLIDRNEETLPEAVRRRLVLKQTESPTRKFLDIRTLIVLKMAAKNPHLHKQLKGVGERLRAANEDPVVNEKLTVLLDQIS